MPMDNSTGPAEDGTAAGAGISAGAGSSAAALRLRRHADFQAVYKVARKQYAKEMSFFFAKRPPVALLPPHVPVPPAGPRVGLTVGKVLGKAHDRNRIKRRLRQAVRLQAGSLDGLAVDVVLHPRRTYLELDWAAVQAEVAAAFATVRRLADKPQVPLPPRDRKGKAGAGKAGAGKAASSKAGAGKAGTLKPVARAGRDAGAVAAEPRG